MTNHIKGEKLNEQIVYSNALISNGTKQEKFKRDRLAQKMIKTTTSMDLKKMKDHGDEAYEIFKRKEDCLIEAYNDKKLKSKNLIKQAKKIIKRREEIENKKEAEIIEK